MYVDGELGAAERRQAKAHLADCAACRAELAALQQLFEALEEIAPATRPAPNLVPGVLAQIRPHRSPRWSAPPARRRWLIPTLQAAVALALLAWGWTWLANQGVAGPDPLQALRTLGAQGGNWLATHWKALSTWAAPPWAAPQWLTHPWTALRAWPGGLWNQVQAAAGRITTLGDLGLPIGQLTLLGAMTAILWLVGNTVLLRRARINERTLQRRY